MTLFGCRACKAKDEDLAFLRAQVKQLQDAALNIADQHLNARLAAAQNVPPRPADRPKGPAASGANRYKGWRSRTDRPVPTTPEELEQQTAILDQEFKVGAES